MQAIQFIAAGIVPQKKFPDSTLFFDEFLEQRGTPCGSKRLLSWNKGRGVMVRCRSSIRRSFSQQEELPSMTLTVAHISPVMSVIAGLLILIMPRLLNFIVAIFLILNGLIGLGLLRWLHL
jgi:Protein of unknown function (DUF3096)